MAKRKEQWFCVVQDEGANDYAIPIERSDDWHSYDWEANDWNVPEWARMLSGSGLQFQTWREHYD